MQGQLKVIFGHERRAMAASHTSLRRGEGVEDFFEPGWKQCLLDPTLNFLGKLYWLKLD